MSGLTPPTLEFRTAADFSGLRRDLNKMVSAVAAEGRKAGVALAEATERGLKSKLPTVHSALVQVGAKILGLGKAAAKFESQLALTAGRLAQSFVAVSSVFGPLGVNIGLVTYGIGKLAGAVVWAGKAMVGLIRSSADAADELRELGLITDAQGELLRETTRDMDAAWVAVKGLAAEIASAMAPAIQEAAAGLTDFVTMLREFIATSSTVKSGITKLTRSFFGISADLGTPAQQEVVARGRVEIDRIQRVQGQQSDKNDHTSGEQALDPPEGVRGSGQGGSAQNQSVRRRNEISTAMDTSRALDQLVAMRDAALTDSSSALARIESDVARQIGAILALRAEYARHAEVVALADEATAAVMQQAADRRAALEREEQARHQEEIARVWAVVEAQRAASAEQVRLARETAQARTEQDLQYVGSAIKSLATLFEGNQAVQFAVMLGEHVVAGAKAIASAPFPANIPAVIGTAAQIAASVAAWSRAEAAAPSLYRGGMAPEPGAVSAELHRGEGVLTRRAMDEIGGPNGLLEANRGRAGRRTEIVLRLDHHVLDRVLVENSEAGGVTARSGRQAARAQRPPPDYGGA